MDKFRRHAAEPQLSSRCNATHRDSMRRPQTAPRRSAQPPNDRRRRRRQQWRGLRQGAARRDGSGRRDRSGASRSSTRWSTTCSTRCRRFDAVLSSRWSIDGRQGADARPASSAGRPRRCLLNFLKVALRARPARAAAADSPARARRSSTSCAAACACRSARPTPLDDARPSRIADTTCGDARRRAACSRRQSIRS